MNRCTLVLGLALSLLAGPAMAWGQEELALLAVPEEEQEQGSRWGFSASVLIDKFDTGPLSGIIESALNADVDIIGRSFDLGVTRGRPGSSYFRITYFELSTDDGSSALDFDNNTFYETQGVKIKGARFQGVLRFGKQSWRVAPALSVHLGAGRVSGTIFETRTLCCDFNPETNEIFEVREMFVTDAAESIGSSWLPTFGIGLGVTTQIQERISLTAMLIGIELAGFYTGSIQAVVWF